MTSYSNLSQSRASHSPTSSPAAETSNPNASYSQYSGVTRTLCNLLEGMNKSTNSFQPGPSSSASSSMPYDIWAPAPNPHGPIGREYHSSNNNQLQSKEDNSSGSPGTSSSVSMSCFRCDSLSPTNRCLECNDYYCNDCSHRLSSDCHLREDTLVPTHQISPIGVRPNSAHMEKDVVYCDTHNEPVRFYCEACASFICQECTLWVHKDHSHFAIKGALDVCRIGIYRAIEDTRSGTKAIKSAIDRAVVLTKAYEKETAEASMKIRKAMRCFTQAIEDREKYLLEKIEKMRQAKMNELQDHMHTLRGILAGLAHTNENLIRSMDAEGIDLIMAKEKGRSQVDYFSCMFKNMYITDERIVFVAPNYDLLDQLKRQCDVQSGSAILGVSPRQAFLGLHAAQSYPPISYNPSHSGNQRSQLSIQDYRPFDNHDPCVSSNEAMEHIGIGQAIAGHWAPISVRPTRSPVPGVPMYSFAREGQEQGQVSRPWGLCIDKEGNYIVADRRNNRIQIFNRRGDFKLMFGCKGSGPGEFDLPAGITVDIYSRIVVIDKDNHRVQIFTASGNFLLKFGSFGKDCGQFQYPWDVAVNTQGNIIVTDTRNHRIQLFTSDGTYITKFVFEGANPSKMLKGPTTPRGVCFTTSGHIIVSDFENHRLLMVDPTLSKVLHCVGREGSGIGELNRPSGIVTDDDGRIIVADSKNHRALVFTSELRILFAVELKSPGLDDKDRPSDVALTPEGFLVVLFETLPDTARDVISHGKQYIKIY